jgi:hypothetical protein
VPDNKLEELSDAEFEVVEVEGPLGGPAAAIENAASFMVGEAPGVRRGELDPDPVAVEKALRSKAKPRAKLFQMEDAAHAQEYADLEQRSLTTGEVNITKIREVTDGVKYSLFICWLEFPKPPEVLRETIEMVMREKKAAFLQSIEKPRKKKESAEAEACEAMTGKGSRCTRKKKVGQFCGMHVPKSPAAVPMDAPPPSHVSLGDTV